MRQAYFQVTLTKTSTSVIEVDYATKDGTAKAPEDYTPTSGTLTFLPGQRVKNITVMVRDAIPDSLTEQFTITLSKPRNCQLGRDTGILEFATGAKPYKNGPLIKNGLLTNAYHKEVGRGGYFHEFSGTSEGQSIAIEGAFLAYAALKDGTTEERAAAAWYKQIGQKLIDAMGTGSATGPMLRQPVPSDPNTITLLHWLFAARGDIPEQSINYSFEAVPSAGKITIPEFVNDDHKGGADIYRIFMIFPSTSQLLYTSPYSPAFDKVSPGADTSIRIDTEAVGDAGSAHWDLVDGSVVLTLPPEASTSVTRWVVVYGYNNAGTIKQGQAQEAYPVWTSIEDSYAACAPDTFRWFEYAMTVASQHDDRSGKAATWELLRAALRRTAVRGQNISDLREIFKPMPNFPAIPASGEPSGMFCYSSNPNAGTPSESEIKAGASKDWVGYKYWRRQGGAGKSSPTLEQLQSWTIDDAFRQLPLDPGASEVPNNNTYELTGREKGYAKLLNGSLQATVPTTGPNTYVSYQYQIGRGVNDTWRSGNAYQDPDQFLLVVTTGMDDWTDMAEVTVPQFRFRRTQKEYFISLSKAYDPTKRYVAKAAITRDKIFRPSYRVWNGDGYSYGAIDIETRSYITVFPYRVNGFFWNGIDNPTGNDPSKGAYWHQHMRNAYRKTDFMPGQQICFELIPIEAFQRMDKPYVEPTITEKTTTDFIQGYPYLEFDKFPVPAASAANILPRDAVIENFGLSWNPAEVSNKDTRDGGILFMRMLSGPSKQWVLDNLHKAIRGSTMPFFPGAMPFAINANVKNQSFVGFNGNPFHGYQLPDYWWFLQGDAQYVHPDLVATDLATAALSGAVEYVISAKTSAGVTKPKHALLAEQQLIFLVRAQEKWAADAGYSGPFAHTFVLNTPARQTIGNPTPHTWVYTNDDPNTRWVGYQVRVVESLAKLAWLARSDTGWATAVTLSRNMAVSWLTRLNVDWPNLNGKDYVDPVQGTIKVYGMPTDYDNPATKGITTAYEEPHSAALVLRAAIWLQLSGKLNASELTLVRTIAKRCWDYMEMRWRTGEGDTMRYTWANTNATTSEQYYGFWHFEIITTICHLLENPSTIPDGATAAILRDRLVKTQTWTQAKSE